jgi:hypothetical protein
MEVEHQMNARMILLAAMCALTLASTAGGYTAGRVLTVRSGDSADFSSKGWRCNNRPRFIDCFSGVARPFVKLAIRHSCRCVGLKVYNLRSSRRPTRTYENGDALYTFIAF